MPKLSPLACLVFINLSVMLPAQDAKGTPTPRALIEKAIVLAKSDKQLPRYTYFMLEHTQNRTQKGKTFFDTTTLYEYTWIGDLPYGRIVELQGKPLKGKALKDEQARYERAIADHEGLDVDARAKAKHYSVVDRKLHLEPLLTSAYTIHELRQETLAGNLTHVVDCIPDASGDVNHPPATRHVTLWITDSGIVLREMYQVVADEADKLHGSYGQEDFQLIDGNRLPQHRFFHLNAPNGNTGDFEDTYSRFRRFNVSVHIVPATESPSNNAHQP